MAEATARIKHIRISPRKVRLGADLIRQEGGRCPRHIEFYAESGVAPFAEALVIGRGERGESRGGAARTDRHRRDGGVEAAGRRRRYVEASSTEYARPSMPHSEADEPRGIGD